MCLYTNTFEHEQALSLVLSLSLSLSLSLCAYAALDFDIGDKPCAQG